MTTLTEFGFRELRDDFSLQRAERRNMEERDKELKCREKRQQKTL